MLRETSTKTHNMHVINEEAVAIRGCERDGVKEVIILVVSTDKSMSFCLEGSLGFLPLPKKLRAS
jgi:hypothetical protein